MSGPAPADAALRDIETRHEIDARWFEGGLHDPNGYVALAHKDRGALLERLRALRTGEKTIPAMTFADIARTAAEWSVFVNPPSITIPKAAYDWLMGEGPDDEGKQFGEGPVIVSGPGLPRFWWRTTFRRMCGR